MLGISPGRPDRTLGLMIGYAVPPRLAEVSAGYLIWSTRLRPAVDEVGQEIQKPRSSIFDRAFPDSFDIPPCSSQLLLRVLVPGNIAVQLLAPECDVACRSATSPAIVPMPETTVDKNRCSELGECDVGPAGEVF